ncbi:glutathione ABC transporter substrate-binding protein GsiB [Pullulanibacillus sp. KACC 23026]|uniref:glutathione ABC transporter substrate-binding protein GsiB n=1 Tax=Pullulanibacillus sp. KACC 23026 TaxID=3028315 RepID=UPI0023B1A448|nr:glutathione ABC transporter substrate-binding protein GsiB [Pullulanibacillus sp. KACC 23026]WEG12598.1 glutathione ABC transporter substrate-binding protein GsiB [Pullulanibacillus sp. KACC 23026]
MKKSLFGLMAILLVLMLALAGCSSKSTNAGSTGTGGGSSGSSAKKVTKNNKDITIGVSDNFVSLDPHDTNDTLSFSAEKTMYEGLVGFDKDMKIVPVLAKSYSANANATEFTFKLKKGIKFQDGTPFNAEAVKANIDRLADPNSKLKRHSLFAMVKETKVVDDYTVKVILSQPFGAMINNFAHPAAMMISPTALKKYGNDIAKHPVGTGPYKFAEWVPGDHLKVVKNPDYWQKGKPKLDSITFKPTPEDGSRIAMLQTGEADMIYPVPTEQAKSVNGKNGISVVAKPSIIVRYLSMNVNKKPFNNVKVRQAINYAINKDAFIKVVMNGYADPMKSVIAPNTQFYSEQQPYTFNLAKAKELLKEAGYPNGFTTTLWGSNTSASTKAMEFIQQQLAQVNIKVNVVPMESGTMSDKIWGVQDPKKAQIEMYYGGWSPSTGDADWGIRPLLSGDSFPPSSYNTAYYKNDQVDSLIQDALKTADPTKRKAAYDQMQKIIWNDAPWAALDVDDTIYATHDYLKGAYLLPDGSLDVTNAEIQQ